MYDIDLLAWNGSKYIFKERLGFYNPNMKEDALIINTERLAYWFNEGAKTHKSFDTLLIKYIGVSSK